MNNSEIESSESVRDARREEAFGCYTTNSRSRLGNRIMLRGFILRQVTEDFTPEIQDALCWAWNKATDTLLSTAARQHTMHYNGWCLNTVGHSKAVSRVDNNSFNSFVAAVSIKCLLLQPASSHAWRSWSKVCLQEPSQSTTPRHKNHTWKNWELDGHYSHNYALILHLSSALWCHAFPIPFSLDLFLGRYRVSRYYINSKLKSVVLIPDISPVILYRYVTRRRQHHS